MWIWRNTMDKLSREVAKALAAGMSYGKWKAMQPIVKPEAKPVEVDKGILDNCNWCGKPFNSTHGAKYCCDECRYEGNRHKANERERRRYWEQKANDQL